MTTALTIEPVWAGETVAVLGNAPCLDAELEYLPRPIHAIACNQAVIKAPWVDMMVSIDANWRLEADGYQGVRIIGFESPDIDACFLPIRYEEVVIGPAHTIHIRSNLLAAIRIAAQAGAAKVLLVGIDPEFYEANLQAPGTVAGLAALIVEMTTAGVVVERFRIPDDARSAADVGAD
ncbi:hypothetical protein GJ700_12710 [Duganella sp. FT92W]|uniref:Uncharacterized protein n=1 Tax=Pseudoduganella rivuli TaxID=2666085 RepID=A0A7X2LU69_9BURK|nr:hypothetical protein [Pseudoduganella rivuli]MRV72569.1 hypothetical protein [Pseudoduganella rivuli]